MVNTSRRLGRQRDMASSRGGALLVAFPLAYLILMPALHVPILVMLLRLVLRGVASSTSRQATSILRSSSVDPRDELGQPSLVAPRIHGELLKLGIDVRQTSVAKYIGAAKATSLARLENVPLQSCRLD